MKLQALVLAALVAVVAPSAAFATTGTLKFKGGCAVSDSGSCTLGITGTTGSVKIYAASSATGNFGAVSRAFTAPGTKRIANSSNNVCFYARATDSRNRTRIICLQ